MQATGRTRLGALAVMAVAAGLGFAACGSSGGTSGTAASVTTSTPASTSFRTIPVTSTTTTAPPATPAPQAASQAAASGGGTSGDTYTIRSGDAWALIAKRTGVALDALLAANGATPDTPLYTGRTVRVPPAGSSAAAAAGSGSASPAATAPAGFILHTVKVGDTWVGIAKKYGVSWKKVMSANGITPDLNSRAPLTVGGQIKVPKG